MEVSKTVSKNLGILNKVKYNLPRDAMLTLYYSLIYPHLTYGITTWGTASLPKLNRLFLRQKRALRIITLSKYNAHTEPLFLQLNVLKIFDIYSLHIALIVYKATHNPFSIQTLDFFFRFHFSNVLKNYNTRSASSNLNKPSARTQLRNSTLSFAGPRIWNPLQDYYKSLPTISQFKKELTAWFISHYVA